MGIRSTVGGLFSLLGLGVVGVGGALYYMDAHYQTTSPCQAMTRITAEEMPAAVAEFADEAPPEVRLLYAFTGLFEGRDEAIRTMTMRLIEEREQDREEEPNPLGCFVNMVMADLDRDGFRADLKASIRASLEDARRP
jgi:hypothetical protein